MRIPFFWDGLCANKNDLFTEPFLILIANTKTNNMLTQKTAQNSELPAKKMEFGAKMTRIPAWHCLTFPDLLLKMDAGWWAEILSVKPRTVYAWQQLERAPQKEKAVLLVWLSGGVIDAEKIYAPYILAALEDFEEVLQEQGGDA